VIKLKKALYIHLILIVSTFFLGCEKNFSRYEVGEVPAANEVFQENYLEKINRAIESSPSNAELYYIKAAKLLEVKKNNSALRSIEKALDLIKNEEINKYHLLAAKIYAENQKYNEALEQINIVQKLGQTSANTAALLADIFWRQGILGKADSISKIAIAKDPYNAEYYKIRGDILWSKNDTIAAKKTLLKSIELGPASATYEKILEIYLASKEYNDAFQVLNHLIRLHPDDISLYYRKAEIYSNIDKNEDARSVYRDIIQKHPGSEEAYFNLSDMYFKNLRYDSAIYFQNQLIARDSTMAQPYLNLARIYDRRFWYTQATDYYNRFLQLDPDNLLAREELEQVESKIRYVNRLQQERERLSNATNLRTIKKEQPKKIE